MQKTAKPGERGVLNKLREMTNISGRSAETFFNPQFKKVMDHIRKKDDQIRSFVVGKRLGDAENDPGAPALKDIFKEAKSKFNRREFMAAAHSLGSFHEQVKKVVLEIESIDDVVEEVHNEFLFKELTPEQRENLKGFKTRFAKQQSLLVKEAGLGDFLHNIGTTRGRALAAWEKRYPNKVKEIKNGIDILLQKSENLLNIIISELKEMASARASRDVDKYMKGTVKITASFNGYEKVFKEFYKNVFSKYLLDMERYQQRNQTTPSAAELGSKDIPSDAPAAPAAPAVVSAPAASLSAPHSVVPAAVSPPHAPLHAVVDVAKQITEDKAAENLANLTDPEGRFKTMPVPPPAMEQGRHSTILPPGAVPPPGKLPAEFVATTHKKFYSFLESLSNESPSMLGLFIKKYANSIRVTDPNTASKLFKIAQQIKG